MHVESHVVSDRIPSAGKDIHRVKAISIATVRTDSCTKLRADAELLCNTHVRTIGELSEEAQEKKKSIAGHEYDHHWKIYHLAG